jgi:nicotinate-nucleotide adenylyltransferase
MAIANYLVQFTELDEVWFVVSPQNPFKERKNLLADYHRYEMLNRAIDGFKGLKVSSIEFTMPKPSYTADTLVLNFH